MPKYLSTLHCIKSKQYPQAQKITAGVIIGPRRNNYPRGRACKKKSVQNFFFRKSLTVPKMSYSTHSLSLYIAEHTQLVSKTEELSASNQNRAGKTIILHQPIRIEHEKILQLRQPIRIEYYVTRLVSQSESSITSPESSWLGWKNPLGSRLLSARYNLS